MLNLFSRAYTVQSRSFIPRDYLKRYAHKCSSKSKGPPWKILFFGTDPFSLHSLKSLCAKFRTGTLISSLGVVAKKHSAVSKFCAEEKLPLYFWPVNEEEIQSLYDIGMVVSFGNLIPRSTIEALPLGCINVHASLLPRWRGAAPIIHAVMAGDTETGVTIMRIHPDKFDVGEIVRQYRVSIGAHERAIELEKRLSIIGSDLLMECLRDLPKCVQMAVPQPKEGISYAPKVVPSVANVNLKSTSAQSLYNRHRAISHLFNLKVKWHGQVVKLKSISLDTHNKGIDFKQKIISLDGTPIKMQIWDTAGQERFRTLTTAYYRGAMGILLMYDVTNQESFNNLSYWLKNIEENASPDVVKVLAGNKCDASSQRVVLEEIGQKLAENYDIPFYEVSCKQNVNIEAVFLTLARLIRDQRTYQRIPDTVPIDSGQNGNITLDLKSRILEHTSLKEPLKCAC